MQLGNKVKMERITEFTRNRESHFERKECFSAASCKVLANFTRKRKFRFSLLSDAYVIIISMPMFATYRVKVERIIAEVLTVVLCTFEVRERFPNFLMVIEICLVIPLQSVCCERGNSCLNRIMCDFRSTLGVFTVEAFKHISINGVSPEH